MEQQKDKVQVSPQEDWILYHGVIAESLDENNKEQINPVAFKRDDLSVFATGTGLAPLDVADVLKMKDVWVAAVAIPALPFIAGDDFKLILVHDPFDDPDGNPQHPNHARLVCRKTVDTCKAIKDRVIKLHSKES